MDAMISGDLDLHYLQNALARAGVPLRATGVVVDSLTGGRMSSAVTRVCARTDDGSEQHFVIKVVPSVEWRRALGTDSTEARLWLSGATRALPAGLRCPTIDVARHASRAEWWILMEDVSSGILPRGTFDDSKANALMRSLARMHARYWGRDEELAKLPLSSFERSSNAFAALSVHVARGASEPEPWLVQLSEDFAVPRMMMPAFLGALSGADADFYVALCQNHARIATALARYPQTLSHGDLRRANISFMGDDVVLFDWELASRAPAARDLEWNSFLQFWAYPPNDGRTWRDGNGLRDTYFDTLQREGGVAYDRARFDESCELGWLSVLCQIGCLLADALTDASVSTEAAARTKRVMAEAMERARRIFDRHVH